MSATLKEVPVLLGQTTLLHHDEKGQTNSDVSSLKPWHFKPKKARYQVEARSGQTKKFNQKRWSDEQNRKYAEFLARFSSLVRGNVAEKRKFHLNRMMSKYVGTRTAVQCRSHHQKMLKTYGNSQNIISELLTKSSQTREGEEREETSNVSEGESREEKESGLLERLPLVVPEWMLLTYPGERGPWSLEESSFWLQLSEHKSDLSFI